MNKQILVADDDAAILKLISQLAGEDGHTITQCRDGLEAIEAIKSQRFDLIICDENLPGLKGSEIVRWMREKIPTKYIPFILISATYDTTMIARLTAEKTIHGFIPKPFQNRQLQTLIRIYIKQ